MNVINKPIEMVAAFNKDGDIIPVRFRLFAEDESYSVFTIDKILHVDKKKVDKVEFILFYCQTSINDTTRLIEVKYMKETLKWYLYRM